MGQGTFKRGSGCYVCTSCDKRTRETGQGESGCDLCLACYEDAGWENEHSDYHHNGVTDSACPLCVGVEPMTKQEKLIKYHEAMVEKVKGAFPTSTSSSWSNERNQEYVEHAELRLAAVKMGFEY